MLICRVVGDVVSTIKNEHLHGHKLLLVQPVELDGKTEKGETLIAVDKVDAGPHDLVLVNREGGGARMLLDNPKIPVQAVIVGVIDALDTPSL
ncbi:ethanolamine utilization protein EutN [candidate division KSB1 bacterium]|nr:MAG: ethanolamine utilization protein EutN [candidate division KSB1 bacterium]MBC6946459.1 ethanolamine utilization protein EutN [candidate division KSB1 bacterium]MCE7942353.1 ethanolamine utilization protein EutN [Chlorobi bacterium CHB1]MDL1877212.1 ethanolamine utilization protein EutN [Cytophagia bacterium CHB2]